MPSEVSSWLRLIVGKSHLDRLPIATRLATFYGNGSLFFAAYGFHCDTRTLSEIYERLSFL